MNPCLAEYWIYRRIDRLSKKVTTSVSWFSGHKEVRKVGVMKLERDYLQKKKEMNKI